LDRAALDPERRPVGRSGNTGFTQEMIPVMPAGKRLAKSVPDGSRSPNSASAIYQRAVFHDPTSLAVMIERCSTLLS
jgi:hypothetical protein